MITEILFGAIALGVMGAARKSNVSGVGALKRAKRRVFKEVATAQQSGIDFERKIGEYSQEGLDLIEKIGKQFGWKQSKRSIESGKPYAEAYYNSLKRAYNSVSGCQGVGTTYAVKNGDGQTVLTWTDPEALLEHVEAEKKLEETERRLAKLRQQKRKRAKLPETYTMQTEEPANESYVEIPSGKNAEYEAYVRLLSTLPEAPKHITIQEIFELRKNGEFERAFAYVLPMYAQHHGHYTTLCMFWTAVDMCRLCIDRGDILAARWIYRHLEVLYPNLQDSDKSARKTLDELASRLQNAPVYSQDENGQLALFGVGYAAAKQPFWMGIPAVEFVYHGEWADPELYYRGKLYNCEVVEEYIYSDYKGSGAEAMGVSFEDWARQNADYIKSVMRNEIEPVHDHVENWEIETIRFAKNFRL